MGKKFSLFLAALVVSVCRASTVETATVQSRTMGRDIPVSIILPDEYQEGAQRYPVLYLLHGAGDTHRKWIDKTVVETLADTYGMIMVCPDGELAISIGCGSEDFFIGVNRALHAQLLEAGVKHGYTEMPGSHNWGYWNEAIQRQIHFIDQQFKQ